MRLKVSGPLLVGAISFGLNLPFLVSKVEASPKHTNSSGVSYGNLSSKNMVLRKRLFELLPPDPALLESSEPEDTVKPVTFLEQMRDKVEASVASNTRQSFRILQFGDSHTAGDFFTNQLRISLKQRFGDAGIGWIQPFSVPGQRTATYAIKRSGSWTTEFQKSRAARRDLPIGGYSALGTSGSRLAVIPTKPLPLKGRIKFSALVRPVNGSPAQVSFRVGQQPYELYSLSKDWQLITAEFVASKVRSYDFSIESGMVEVAALFLDTYQKGVTVEAIGRNSAELSWQQNWSDESFNSLSKGRPVDLIVLAYGTNEAVDFIDSKSYYNVLNRQIERFQILFPQVPIIILSTPSFAQYPNGSCRQPRSLMQIHAAQKLAAETLAGVSTWSWLEAMGGPCAVSIWSSKGLMASDWIHFSASGYRQSALLFMHWLASQPIK